MKPNEEELKLLAEIVHLKERLQTAQNKVRVRGKELKESNLPIYQQVPFLTPLYHLKAHTSKVHDVVWSPGDKYVLTIGAEGCIVLWETQTGLIHNVVDASSIQPLTATALSDDAEKIFCGGLCANVVLYNSKHRPPEDGYSYYENNLVYEHTGQVNTILCHQQTKLITTSLSDGALVWDIEKVRITGRFPHNNCSVQSLTLLTEEGNSFLTGSDDGVVRRWDIRQPGVLVCSFEPHQSDVNCIRPFPNGENFVTGSEDAFIHLYDLRTDVTLARFFDPYIASQQSQDVTESSMTAPPEDPVRPEAPAVCDIAVSTSGRMLLAGGRDSIVYFWDIAQPDQCLHREVEIGPVMKLVMSHKKTALVMMTWDPRSRIRIMRPR
ncbi:unnamed protein product [Calicophoron daubneyi]|uniref:Uncharacterized protein n=1 Tax=Calicophoron daubneyi TaxID=300641 RepID=A0AAV2T8S8_CALDB